MQVLCGLSEKEFEILDGTGKCAASPKVFKGPNLSSLQSMKMKTMFEPRPQLTGRSVSCFYQHTVAMILPASKTFLTICRIQERKSLQTFMSGKTA